jgi:hypothetical protein
MKRPEEVTLSREEGEALLTRLERDALTAEDRQVLVKVLTFYFWLLFALREAKLSLKRLKALVFGEKAKKREPPESGGSADGGGSPGGTGAGTAASQGGPAARERGAAEAGERRPGHGRQSAAGCIVRRNASSAGMRNWRWASAAQRVAGGGCLGYRRASRCG